MKYRFVDESPDPEDYEDYIVLERAKLPITKRLIRWFTLILSRKRVQ